MNIYNALANIVLIGLLFVFPLMIYINLRRFKTAALGRLFSNKAQTLQAFQFFAVAMIIYALNVFINILDDLYPIPILNYLYIIISIVLTLLLIYVFYKLYRIMKI